MQGAPSSWLLCAGHSPHARAVPGLRAQVPNFVSDTAADLIFKLLQVSAAAAPGRAARAAPEGCTAAPLPCCTAHHRAAAAPRAAAGQP